MRLLNRCRLLTLNQRHLLTRQLVRKPVAPWATQHLFLSTIAGKSMKAFGIKGKGGGVDALEELQLPQPELRSHDILIRVESCALNPIDTKLRKLTPPPGGFPKVLGFDGAGTVVTCGSEARSFEAGDKVFFAGSHIRNGSNAEFVAVDERIVGRMPKTINAATASSVPLCALTAWEGLEQLGINPLSASNKKQCLLMLPGAGGVGCYGIQFAKLAGLQVVATASRPESEAACRHLGADHVVNHKLPLKPQLDALGISQLDYIYDAVSFENYATQFVDLIKPFGKIVTITTVGKASIDPFKAKAVSICWELMFVRSAFTTEDIAHQGEILNAVSALIDSGKLKTPIWKTLPWSLESLRKAHELQESGQAIGKIVMTSE